MKKIIAVWNTIRTNKKPRPETGRAKPSTFEKYQSLAEEKGVEFLWRKPDEIMDEEHSETLIIMGIFIEEADRKRIFDKFSRDNKIMFPNMTVKDISKDKFKTFEFLKRNGLPTPATELFDSSRIGTYKTPFVLKRREGSMGNDVFLIRENKDLDEIYIDKEDNYIVQEYLEETHGRSVRVTYIDGDYYIYKLDNGENFLSNRDKGGATSIPENAGLYLKQARQVVEVLESHSNGKQIEVAVDLSVSEKSPQVIELNSFPGIDGILRHYKDEFWESLKF